MTPQYGDTVQEVFHVYLNKFEIDVIHQEKELLTLFVGLKQSLKRNVERFLLKR